MISMVSAFHGVRPTADNAFSFFIYKMGSGDNPLGGSGKSLAQKLANALCRRKGLWKR